MKGLFLGGAALLALSMPAAAGTVTYSSYSFNGIGVNILSPFPISGGAGLITLNSSIGPLPEWCVDVYTYLAGSSPVSSPYVQEPLAGGQPGVPFGLTHTQIGEMGALMAYGNGFTDPVHLGEAQLGIWTIEYGSAFTYNGVPASIVAGANTLVADAIAAGPGWAPDYNVTALVDIPQVPNQTLANVGASIPEPSTWLMVLAGFTALGFVGRRKPDLRLA